jgi:leucyl aminopeptidase
MFVFSGKDKTVIYTQECISLDGVLHGAIKKMVSLEGFEATVGNTMVVQTQEKLPFVRIIIVGCGEKEKLTAYAWQMCVAAGAKCATTLKAQDIAIAVPEEIHTTFGVSLSSRYAIEGIGLGTYTFLHHKNKTVQKEHHEIEKVLFVATKQSIKETMQGIVDGSTTTGATILARDLVNEPSSIVTPTYLGKLAKVFAKSSHIQVTVFGKKEMEQMGMHALLGIAQGSNEQPKFIKLEYHGSKKTGEKSICLVGKGITYDSGGLSLKSQSGLETMKCDMAGAAAILGVFQALATFTPDITVTGLIAATENMPSGHAIKPGDIVTAMNGKTIEIINTDAEGRVVLADALSYAEKYIKADYVIDLATLTGACMVALGEDIAGLFSDDEAFITKLMTSANIAGEKFWRLPLATEYQDELKSTVADIRNVSKIHYGGAINGALFLKEFVSEKTSWAHMDIAGPAYAEKDTALIPYGGTGFGVRTLLTFILEAAKRI